LLDDEPGRARMRKSGDDSVKMFEPVQDGTLEIDAPAAHYNNVSVAFSENTNITLAACVSDKNKISVISWDPKIEKKKRHVIVVTDPNDENGPAPTCFQVKFVTPSSRNAPLIVVASTAGAMIYDSAQQKNRMSFNPIAGVVKSDPDSNERPFCRGISCVDNTILVGTCTGTIMVFNCSGGTSVSVKKPISEHKYPIADIATCKFDEITASGDMKGGLIVWTKGMKVNKRINTELQITVLNVLRRQVLVGTVYGGINIYATTSGVLMASVAAHARAVTGISVAPESAYVLTASEDSSVRVFKLHTRKPEAYQLEFRYGDHLDDKLIVGACFANDRGSSMVFAAFDFNFFLLYKIFKKTMPQPVELSPSF
ncbi:hypothetical protein PMAYCL1PPCAC_11283, partial [Pristionchus mayeri]